MGYAKDVEGRDGPHGRANRQSRPRIGVKPFGNGQLGPIALSLGLPWGAIQGVASLRALGPTCRVRTGDLLTDKPLIIDDPRIERRHAPRTERTFRQSDVDAILENAEVRMLVGADELARLRFRMAVEFAAVERDAIGGEAGAGIAIEPPDDVRRLPPPLDEDQVVVDRQAAVAKTRAGDVDCDHTVPSAFAILLFRHALDARIQVSAACEQCAGEEGRQERFLHAGFLRTVSRAAHCRPNPSRRERPGAATAGVSAQVERLPDFAYDNERHYTGCLWQDPPRAETRRRIMALLPAGSLHWSGMPRRGARRTAVNSKRSPR